MNKRNGNVKMIKNQSSNLGMFLLLFAIAVVAVLIPAGLAAYAGDVTEVAEPNVGEVAKVDEAIDTPAVVEEEAAVENQVIAAERFAEGQESAAKVAEADSYSAGSRNCLLTLTDDTDIFRPVESYRYPSSTTSSITFGEYETRPGGIILPVTISDDGSFTNLTCKTNFETNGPDENLKIVYSFKVTFFGDGEEIGTVTVQRKCLLNDSSLAKYSLGITGQIYSIDNVHSRTKTGLLFEGQALPENFDINYRISCTNCYSVLSNNDYVADNGLKGSVNFIHDLKGFYYLRQMDPIRTTTMVDDDDIYSFYGDTDMNRFGSDNHKFWGLSQLENKLNLLKYDNSEDSFAFEPLVPESNDGLMTLFAGWSVFYNGEDDLIDQSAPGKRKSLLTKEKWDKTEKCLDIVANFVSAKEFKVNVKAQISDQDSEPVAGAKVTYTITDSPISLEEAQRYGLQLQATTNADGVATLVVPSEIPNPTVLVDVSSLDQWKGYMTNVGTADPSKEDSVDVLLYKGRWCRITGDAAEGHNYFEHVIYRDGHMVNEPEIVDQVAVALDPDSEDDAWLEVCKETEQWPDKFMNLHYHNEYDDNDERVVLDSFWKPVGQDYFKILYYTDGEGKEFNFMWIDPSHVNANGYGDYEPINIEAHYQGSANVTFETDHTTYDCNYKIAGVTAMDYQITETFTDLLYSGTEITADGGTLQLAYSGPAEIESVQNESGTVKANPEQGYSFVKWTINGQDVSDGFTLEAAKDYTVKAEVVNGDAYGTAQTGDNTFNMMFALMTVLISSAAVLFVRKRYDR